MLDKEEEKKLLYAHSEEVEEVLQNTPNGLRKMGVYLLLAILILLFIGSWYFKSPQIIECEVAITSSTPPAQVMSKTSGRLTELLVANQDYVEKDVCLGVLENTARRKDVIELEQWIDTLRNSLEQQQNLSTRTHNWQLGDLQNDYAALLTQLSAYQQLNFILSHSHKLATMKKSLVTNTQQIKHLKQLKQLTLRQYELQQKSTQRDKQLHNQKLISTEELERSEAQTLQMKMSVVQAEASERNQTMQGLQLQTDIDEQELQNGRELNQQLTALYSRIDQLKAATNTWKSNYLLIAPITGKVTFTNYWTKNQQLQAGKVAFTIVPTSISGLIARATLPAHGSGRVRQGQRVNIALDNFPENEYGVIEGKVLRLSLIPDESKNYVVEVELPRGLVTSYHKRLPLSQEMTGKARIITDDVRLLETLIQPIRKIWINQ